MVGRFDTSSQLFWEQFTGLQFLPCAAPIAFPLECHIILVAGFKTKQVKKQTFGALGRAGCRRGTGGDGVVEVYPRPEPQHRLWESLVSTEADSSQNPTGTHPKAPAGRSSRDKRWLVRDALKEPCCPEASQASDGTLRVQSPAKQSTLAEVPNSGKDEIPHQCRGTCSCCCILEQVPRQPPTPQTLFLLEIQWSFLPSLPPPECSPCPGAPPAPQALLLHTSRGKGKEQTL